MTTQQPENDEEEGLLTVAFEYDLTCYGGNYNGTGSFIFIPVSLIEQAGGEHKAFKQFTGYSSCHIIHHECEEIEYDEEAYGKLEEQVTERDRQAHYAVCEACSKIGVQRDRQKERSTPSST